MLVEWLAKKWSVNDHLPLLCDLLVPVAHGATRNRLTAGAHFVSVDTEGTLRVLRDQGQLPFVAFGAFTGSKNPELERTQKLRYFQGKYVGLVLSTIEECLKVKASLPDFFDPKHITVVTDEAHSRRCRIVWRCFFPNSEITIIAIPIAETVDTESPMWPYRIGMWAILLFQALPTPYFWYLAKRGPEYMATKATSLHQPVAK